MRRKLIATSFSVAALVGVAGGVAFASDADPAAAPPTTTPIDDMGDIFGDLGITSEQGQCLLDSMSEVDLSDMSAMMTLIEQCGITMDQLLNMDPSVLDGEADPSAPTSAGEPTPGAIDPAAAQAVLELLGVESADIACISDGLATAAPGDDNAALTVLQGCGLSLSELLGGLVAVDAVIVAGGTVSTIAGAPGTEDATSTGMVDMLQDQLAAQGITLTDEQAQCILDNISQFDLDDMNSIVSVLETCGISLSDLVPSG